jgi:hypothetical protein
MKRITKEQYRDSSSAASTAEVEPRPNKEMKTPLTVIASRAATWQSLTTNAFLGRDCFAALAMTVKGYGSTFAIRKSRRDDMSVENSTFAIRKSRRDDMSVETFAFYTEKMIKKNSICLLMPSSINEIYLNITNNQ